MKMKVEDLVDVMKYVVWVICVHTEDMTVVWMHSLEDLINEYGECDVMRFWIYENEDDFVLEIYL